MNYALVYYPTRHGPRYVSLHPDETCAVIVNAKREGRYLGTYPEDVIHGDRFWSLRTWAERGEGLSSRLAWAKRNHKILWSTGHDPL